MSLSAPSVRLPAALFDELRKIPAFFRRDWLTMWSYRFALFGDWLNLIVQVVIFFYVSKLIPATSLPTFGGVQPNYMEFVVTGIVPTAFLAIGISRVVAVMRQEQYMGTLEPLLSCPISPGTLLLGSVVYDLLYVPLRSLIFLGVSAALFEVQFNASGLLPSGVILIVFIPFVWGLGMIGSATVLTFKKGLGVVGFVGTFITIGSGTYFPLTLFPEWVQRVMELNPAAIVLEATRNTLIGNAGWSEILPDLAALAPISGLTLALGLLAFNLAIKRERRLGSLGLY